MEVEKREKRYYVSSESFVAAPVEAVYDVLTDYERFDRVSSVFTESRFLERNDDGSGIVYTKAHGCVVFFCKTIERVEQLEVVPNSEIVATVIPERSSSEYGRAHWQLETEGGGTRILYELEMEPGFWIPPVIGPFLIKRSLAKGGEEVVERIERYAAEAAAGAQEPEAVAAGP